MSPLTRIRWLFVVLLLALASPIVAVGQDEEGAAVLAYPGYVQRGTCADPGAPIAALAETATGGGATDQTGVSSGDGLSVPDETLLAALPAAVSVTRVEASLTDLLGDDLIVRIVADAEEPETDVACGVVRGEPDEDGNLYVGLAATNDSDVWGVVWLRADGDDDGATTVTIFLIPVTADDEPSASDSSTD
ncbi:MAG TPA: hypothetical protein VGT61_04955 [Thermomicrobiales bacterium]|jgi:hypothetical protein|nr:hypothetical protein [Thermomicrobiales bacterium]